MSTGFFNSPSWARTNNPSVNSRVLYHARRLHTEKCIRHFSPRMILWGTLLRLHTGLCRLIVSLEFHPSDRNCVFPEISVIPFCAELLICHIQLHGDLVIPAYFDPLEQVARDHLLLLQCCGVKFLCP